MIVWRGWGILAGAMIFGSLLGAEHFTESAFEDDRYYQEHGWPKMAGFFVAALPVWFLGKYLNERSKRVLLDPETYEEVVLEAKHSMFGIPMQYWGPISVVLGIVFVFVKD